MNFPNAVLPYISPLPLSYAEHLLYLLKQKYPEENEQALLALLLQRVQEKRDSVFRYIHPFALNREKRRVPSFVKLSTEWLKRALYEHTPEQIPEAERRVPHSTYTYWVKSGYIHHERFGRPDPHSAAAVLILRMLVDVPGWRLFPPSIQEQEKDRYCLVQLSPKATPTLCRLSELGHLPPSALVWSPWAGEAAWSEGWELIGRGQYYLGSIRFARVKWVDDLAWWDITLKDLQAWDARGASCYLHHPGNEEAQVQALARCILHRLSVSRLGDFSMKKG